MFVGLIGLSHPDNILLLEDKGLFDESGGILYIRNCPDRLLNIECINMGSVVEIS